MHKDLCKKDLDRTAGLPERRWWSQQVQGHAGPLGPPGSRPSCVSLRQAGPLRASPACKYKLQYGHYRVYYIRFALLRATCFTTCLPGSMLPLARKFEPCRWRHGFDTVTVPQQSESAQAPQAKPNVCQFPWGAACRRQTL